jgi:hypothetical protein
MPKEFNTIMKSEKPPNAATLSGFTYTVGKNTH